MMVLDAPLVFLHMRRERLPRVFAQHVLLDRHMQRKHRAVAKHDEQEQQLRQFEPQVDEEAEVDGVLGALAGWERCPSQEANS